MNSSIHFRRPARAEFDGGIAWYEQQQTGLGLTFEQAVQEVLDDIAATPLRYPVVLGDVRQAIVARFPYCVYYRLRAQRIIVVAVFHNSRDPSIWQSRA